MTTCRILSSVLLIAVSHALASTAHAQAIFGVKFKGGRSHNYDVLHTAIDVRFDEGRREVIGSVTHRVRSIADDMSVIRFDADSAMRISRAVVANTIVKSRLVDGGLYIDLPSRARYGDTLTVTIDYRVIPSSGLHFVAPDSTNPKKRRQVWTQGEAEEHHKWVPLYDYPNDRATTEMRITVRDDWKALSNGNLISIRRNSDGTSTWHYRLDRAHSSYLMMLAAGDYAITRDTVDGIPLAYWTYPDMPERVRTTFGRTPDMMRFMTRTIGVAYPWRSYSQVIVSEFPYGGMENTTATTLSDATFIDSVGRVDYSPDGVIAHEIAHQWFGDLVTTRDWGNLWLQESFATYMAALYKGYRYGEEEFHNEMWEGGASALALDTLSGRDPIANGRGLTTNLYARGARVLHMLEQLLGNRPFWRGVQLFLARHGDGLAETSDLRNAMEDATGVELDWFFDQWIIKAGAPHVAVRRVDDGDSVRLWFKQTQQRDSLTGLFQLRLPIAVYTGKLVARDTLWMSGEEDSIAIAYPVPAEASTKLTTVDGAPAPLPIRLDGLVASYLEGTRYVVVDEGQTTLKRMTFPRDRNALVMQLNAPHMLDRWEAVVAITTVDSMERTEDWRSAALLAAFRVEPSAQVRDQIVNGVARLASPSVNDVLIAASTDSASYVRQAAVNSLYRVEDVDARARLLRARLTDSSLRVVAAAIGMLATTDTSGLFEVLMKWRGVVGRSERMAQAWVGAVASARLESLVDDVAAFARAPYNRTTRWQAIVALSALSRTTPAVRRAIVAGLDDRSSNIREAAGEAARAHLDDELREALLNARERMAPDRQAIVDAVLKADVKQE